MESEELLAKRLVARQQQPTRITARIGLAHQLEERHDMLIVRDDPVELLEQIENDVGLPVGNGRAQLGEAVEHAEAVHVMPAAAQCGGYIVLRPPLFYFFVSSAFEAFR